jgi:hypothetical protein
VRFAILKGGTRTKVIRNGPLGREVELTWRGPDYAIVKNERDPADTYDPRARGWYRSAVERRGRAWTEPYIFFTSHKPGITLASGTCVSRSARQANFRQRPLTICKKLEPLSRVG